jgi:hypothetical protein
MNNNYIIKCVSDVISCGYLPQQELRKAASVETSVTLTVGVRMLSEEMGGVYGLVNRKYKTRILRF